MTVPSRPLFLLLAALAGPAGGCVITHKAEPITPAGWQPPADKPATRTAASGFAVELPAAPGVKVPTNPAAKSVADAAPTTPPAQTTSRRPNPSAEPEAPQPPAAASFVRTGSEPQTLPDLAAPAAPTEDPLVAAMRAHAENHPDEAIDRLKGLNKANQEFVLAVLPALVRGATLNLAAADPKDVAVLVDQLQTAAARLENRAALRLDKLLFCREVRGFGLYDPRPAARPYQVGSIALLYAEVRHLVSEPNPKGDGYVTQLVSTLEIRNANGEPVPQADPADPRRTVTVRQVAKAVPSRSPLTDLYVTWNIPVPPAPGVYTVTVEVRSPVGNRVVRSQPVQLLVSAP